MHHILFFEDDLQLSEMMIKNFAKKSYKVDHFNSFNAFLEQGYDIAVDVPNVVILDIELPDVSGYEICEWLKQNGLPEHIPVIFVSGLMKSEDILKAYQVGGHDYIVKPIKFSELDIKLEQNIHAMLARKKLKEDLSNSSDMAFKVMGAMSELGSVLTFHDDCMAINSSDQLITTLFKLMESFQLHSSIVLHFQEPVYRSSYGQGSELEKQTIELLSTKSRIYSWNNRVCFNYPHFSLLIIDMPIENEERYGELKDILCLVLNGLDARFEAIELSRKEKEKSVVLSNTVNRLCDLVNSMSQSNKSLAEQFELIINRIENDIAGDIIQFNLLESEEKVLLSHINSNLKDAQTVFDKSISSELAFKEQVEDITDSVLAAG